MCLVLAHQELDTLKPNQVDDTRPVREMSYQTPLTSLSDRLKTKNLPFQLDIRHIPVYFMNII